MVTDLITLDFKIIENGDCSHEIKRCLLLGRKAVTPRQSIKKQRHNLPTKVLRVKAMFFSSSPVWTDVRVES